MSDWVTIPRRFRGPPDSGNGGFACGLTAAALAGGPVEVSLRAPPPLERALRRVRGDGTAQLHDADQVVSEARASSLALERPPAVTFARAVEAAAAFDLGAYASSHPFPGCFTCGPDRGPGDGLRVFAAPIEPGLVAWPWVPDHSLAASDGAIRPEVLWAALDCPSGLSWITGPDGAPSVLGRMTVVVHRRPGPGEQLVVCGWRIGREGRRQLAGSAVLGGTGHEVLAESLAVWVVLSEAQRAAFGSRS